MLLFRFLRLWYCPLIRTSNTKAHALCIYVHAYSAYVNTQDEHLSVAMFWISMNLPDSRKPKQSAFKTLFCQYVIPFYVSDLTHRFFTLSVPAEDYNEISKRCPIRSSKHGLFAHVRMCVTPLHPNRLQSYSFFLTYANIFQ